MYGGEFNTPPLCKRGECVIAESKAYNMDCMDGMKQYPDKYFDLAVVDPPYGAGFTEGGGCKGWFSKYHENDSQSVQVEREREKTRTRGTASEEGSTSTSVTRTGGTWAEKYAKKS